MVKPSKPVPENVVAFKTDVKMTDWDIKNYLEKIYKVKIAGISSRIMSGKLRRTRTGVSKFEDHRLAEITLAEGQTFKWPDLFPTEKADESFKDYEETLKQLNEGRKLDPNKSGLPTWFS